MKCPKCTGEMTERTYGQKIAVRQCSACLGLFTRPDVLAEMKREWMSEILDAGDRSIGRKLDDLPAIDCPACGTRMDRIADARQTHIRYESCPGCGGIFLDAGEFTDLKRDTLLDRLRDLIRGRPRP